MHKERGDIKTRTNFKGDMKFIAHNHEDSDWRPVIILEQNNSVYSSEIQEAKRSETSLTVIPPALRVPGFQRTEWLALRYCKNMDRCFFS